MKKNAGFTLIELLVVVVITAIIAASAVVGFNSYRETSRNRATEKLISSIDYGRAVSQVHNYPTYIDFKYGNGALLAVIYTMDLSGTKSVKETIRICKSEYDLLYKESGEDEYSTLDRDATITLAYNKSTSGFKSDTTITNFRLDMFEQNDVTLVKETGRAYRTYEE